jgi:hypothetical protein
MKSFPKKLKACWAGAEKPYCGIFFLGDSKNAEISKRFLKLLKTSEKFQKIRSSKSSKKKYLEPLCLLFHVQSKRIKKAIVHVNFFEGKVRIVGQTNFRVAQGLVEVVLGEYFWAARGVLGILAWREGGGEGDEEMGGEGEGEGEGRGRRGRRKERRERKERKERKEEKNRTFKSTAYCLNIFFNLGIL